MVVTFIFELLCLTSLVFMICFLIALFRDGRTKSRCHVVHLKSRYTGSEGAAFMRSNPDSRDRFKLIAGGRDRLSRKVG
jgi:hypothetical protein